MREERRSAAEMFPLVEAYLAGESTQKEFCAARGLSSFVLNYWLRKYRQERGRGTDAFVEISAASRVADGVVMELTYPTGVRLRFFSQVPPSYLAALLVEERTRW